MSIWAHINGNIVLEDFAFQGDFTQPNLGIETHFRDQEDTWDKCTTPRGSEGSLYIQYSYAYSSNSQRRWNATITGDLRDYPYDEYGHAILDWLNSLDVSRYLIRDGLVSVDFEDDHSFIYRYCHGSKAWIIYPKDKQ